MKCSITQFTEMLNTPTRTVHLRMLLGMSVIALTLTACGKDERQMTTEERLKAVQTKQETQPDFFVPRKTVDYMADLKAIRDNAPKTEPAAKPEIVARSEPQRTITQAETRPAASPIVPVQAPVTPQPAPQVIAPVTQAPAPVAAAPRPSADTTTTAINREQPNFPREAVRQGVENGTVRARMSINAAGEVTAVTIVSARPARIFDREVQAALQRWKFNAGADGRSFETEVNFQR